MKCKKCDRKIADDSIFCSFCGKKQIVELPGRKTKSRGNGQGSVYQLPNKKWRAAVTLGYTEEKVRIYKTKSDFKTKKEGLEYLQKLRDESKKPKDIKFSKLYDEWKKKHYSNIGKSKIAAYKIAYKKCKDLYYKNIADIRTPDIQEVIDSVKGYYPKKDIKTLCSLMFKHAIRKDYLAETKNYASFVELPSTPKSKNTSFTDEELTSFWNDYNAGNDFTGYILIMIYTSMRYGELYKIYKVNVFLDKNYMIGGIKTDAGIDREIGIADKIKPIVEKFYNRGKKKLLEMNENTFYERYYKTLERLEIPEKKPHCCRHTFGTLMARAKVQPAIIQSAIGHEKYETTMQYTHIPLSDKLEAINKI